MKTPLRLAVLALLTMALVATTAVVTPPEVSAATSREARMIASINYARTHNGQWKVRAAPDLMRYARAHASRMANRGYLYHTANMNVICCWSSIAENVGYGSSVRQVHRSLMASPSHRANILKRGIRGVGVGIVYRNGRLWVTEVFRDPR